MPEYNAIKREKWLHFNFSISLNSDLDKASDGLASSESRSLSLGNTGLLSLDPLEDRTSLYDRLLETYHWHEKVKDGSYVNSA